MAQLPIPTNLLEAVNGMPLPQTQDSVQGSMAPARGRNGTSLVMHGRVWQVGSGATTTSIPILDSNGLTVLMSASMQALYTQAKFEIVQAGTVELAVVTAVASNGTLTLDSALSSAPSAGTAFLLTPTQQTSLSGSNVTLLNAVSVTGTGTPQSVGTFKSYVFEVYGTATSFDIQVQAVGPSGTARNLKVWDELNEAYLTSDITTAGFYSVDIPAYTNIQGNVVSVSGGNVTVKGGMMQ